jgi:hypothetical protein
MDQYAFAKVDNEKDSNDNDEDEDENKNKDIENKKDIPISTTDSKYDKFGIEKIYSTKTGGEEWFMNMNNIYEDKQFYPFGESPSKFSNPNLKITKNEDLSWKL